MSPLLAPPGNAREPRLFPLTEVLRTSPLTDRRKIGILQSCPGLTGANATVSIKTARGHHAARRRGGVAARGARAAGRACRWHPGVPAVAADRALCAQAAGVWLRRRREPALGTSLLRRSR